MRQFDPFEQIGYLQQVFSTPRRPIGFFLGAGCPGAIKDESGNPLIPNITGITDLVDEKFASCPDFQLIKEQAPTNGDQALTIEHMLTYVRSLRAVAGNSRIRGFSAESLDNLDDALCDSIQEITQQRLATDQTPFHKLANWIRAIDREFPIEVFTTNYDLLIEQALEEAGVPYFDGFPGAMRPRFDLRAIEEDAIPTRWARLWKLHGSINWLQAQNTVLRVPMDGNRGVIHPSHLKYMESRRMPYLAMTDRLRAFTKLPTSVLVFCGYSFGDQHINDILAQSLQSEPTASAFALMFGKRSDCAAAIELAKSVTNLTILGRDGVLVGGRWSNWAETESSPAERLSGKFISWTEDSNAIGRSTYRPELLLGDFQELGNFLETIVGAAAPTRVE